VNPRERGPFRIGLVQERWDPGREEHESVLADGVRLAAQQGAGLVCLQELTVSPYFVVTPDAGEEAAARAEDIPTGPTTRFAARPAAETGAHVHASLYERAGAELGFNNAICVGPSGEVVARTRKQDISVTAGYYEDRYFLPGDSGYPVVEIAGAGFGFPTCWDHWFPELARAYSLGGAGVIVYRPRSALSPSTRSSTLNRYGSASSPPTG
jgi:N-carbamoylputrescine amidase